MAAYGLYTHIQSNKRRSIALLIGLFFLVYVMMFAGALLGEVLVVDASATYMIREAMQFTIKALPWATAGTLLWIVIAYYFHQSMIDAVTGSESVTRKEQPRLYNILENLCISRGITMPKLKIADDDALNAFATGLNEKQYSITVTRGLMEALNDQELEAVLGHELTHIRNGDVRMLVMAVVIAGVISFFGEMVFRIFFQGMYWGGGGRRSSSDREGGSGAGIALVIALALIALVWILAIAIRFALSRQREYLADAGSVELTKNPDAMISALRKIEDRGELAHANSAVMEMCIDNPRVGFSNIFDTHPPIEARVEALVKYAGGHDPGPLALEAPQQAAQLARPPGEPPSAGNTYGGPWGGDAPQDSGSAAGRPWGSAPGEQSGNPSVPAEPPVGLGSRDGGEGPWGPRR